MTKKDKLLDRFFQNILDRVIEELKDRGIQP
jgi:hypothetical protein